MSGTGGGGIENAVLVATGVVQPVVEVLRQLTGATVALDAAEASLTSPREVATALDGWYWAVPLEITGVYNGAACVLVSQELVAAHGDAARGSAARKVGTARGPDDAARKVGTARGPDDAASERFASMIDEYLARAGEKLGPAWGGPVSLDRLGLRRATPESASQVIFEALGPGGLVVVHFPAKRAGADGGGPPGTSAPPVARLEVLAALGGRLVEELLGTRHAGPAATQPVGAASTPRSASDLIRRARALRVKASADVGGRTMTLGELERLAPGSVIDLGKNVTDPLELRVQGRLIAAGDAVTLQRGFGFRVRYLGAR
jgi:flagellar motor switch/type III secretory pathway protein FliN